MQGAVQQIVSNITFTFDTSLTPLLKDISPSRGSTEGGTALTLTGVFPDSTAGNVTVLLGDIPCDAVEVVDVVTIRCTTMRPASFNASAPKPQDRLPVTVLFSGWGYAACTGVNGTAAAMPAFNSVSNTTAASGGSCGVTYQYVDLWSRKTTWGGGDPPSEGDTVMVPGAEGLVHHEVQPVFGSAFLWGLGRRLKGQAVKMLFFPPLSSCHFQRLTAFNWVLAPTEGACAFTCGFQVAGDILSTSFHMPHCHA